MWRDGPLLIFWGIVCSFGSDVINAMPASATRQQTPEPSRVKFNGVQLLIYIATVNLLAQSVHC